MKNNSYSESQFLQKKKKQKQKHLLVLIKNMNFGKNLNSVSYIMLFRFLS